MYENDSWPYRGPRCKTVPLVKINENCVCIGCEYYPCGNPIEMRNVSWFGPVNKIPVWNAGYGEEIVVWCELFAVEENKEEDNYESE